MEEAVKQFFEYEKFDTLEEFTLNFEPFISDYENRNPVIKELIRLFNSELRELRKTRNEEFEQQYNNQVHMQIRKVNKNINYLRNLLEKEEVTKEIKKSKKIDNRNLPITKKNKKTTNNKVDKRKNKNDEIIVSDETMQLIENGFDVEILELNTIVELIKHYQTKKDNLINLKLTAQKNQESEKLDSIYYQIRNCNNLLERLIAKKKEKMEIENKKTKEINNRRKFILPISLNQVREIDEYFGVNTIDLINSIISDDNIDEDKLNQIYITYEDCKKQIFKDKMNLISKKRELKKHKSENNILIEEINGVIEKINIHMDILNNLLNYLKYPYGYFK